MTVTNAKASAESEKFNLKIRSESGKLLTIGCHFPPKSTNFGTLILSTMVSRMIGRIRDLHGAYSLKFTSHLYVDSPAL